ncbi:MAG: hypothetical protein U0936_27515 [Planctomycetaceae bacterium]
MHRSPCEDKSDTFISLASNASVGLATTEQSTGSYATIICRLMRSIVIGAARKKDWRLSRIGILSNHLHILPGAAVTESPQSVALSLMNNIAYVYSMTPVLKFSYYAGTFGGYDRGAIRLHQS